MASFRYTMISLRWRKMLAAASMALGAVWPALFGAISAAPRTPLEAALYASWCGASPHDGLTLLGHCMLCWAGAGAFILAGAALAASPPRRGARTA